MTKQELIEYFNTTKSVIETNFPKFCANQLKHGYLITKQGKGDSANYEVKQVEPETKDKSFFSERQIQKVENLPNEIWIPAFNYPDYQVSNMGRIKNPLGNLNIGHIDK